MKGVVVIDRAHAARALTDLETIARAQYGNKFQAQDYTVRKDHQRWRLGFVFMDQQPGLNRVSVNDLHSLRSKHTKVLSVQGGIVGVLKFDPKKPRVPWGEPAGTVASVATGGASRLLTTDRSARTVLGVLQKFP